MHAKKMQVVTAAALQKNFGSYNKIARKTPVGITTHGNLSLILISVEHYEDLVAGVIPDAGIHFPGSDVPIVPQTQKRKRPNIKAAEAERAARQEARDRKIEHNRQQELEAIAELEKIAGPPDTLFFDDGSSEQEK